jgi:uncharacterized protein (TIGR02453 family)
MTSFTGFGPRALDFFKALAFHQDKAWFEANRGIYETEVKAPLVALLEDVTKACADAKLPFRGDARSIFRLHRDIRFSKDKRPYKTNGGAVLTVDGSKKTPGLLYIHVDPAGCFLAAGFWHPEPDQLLALRKAIAGDIKAFRALLRKLERNGLVLGDGEALSRLPKGFEQVGDEAAAAAVKMRNIVVRRPLPEASVFSPGLTGEVVAFARDAEPLLRFGWSALGMKV